MAARYRRAAGDLLLRLSVEVTYNRRSTSTWWRRTRSALAAIDTMQRYPSASARAATLDYRNPSYDFHTVIAPSDPRLPNGGGYRILGLNTEGLNQPIGAPAAQTIDPNLEYTWHGFDTNAVWDGPWGIRINGGTMDVSCESRHLPHDARRPECERTRRTRGPSRLRHAGSVADEADRLGVVHGSLGGRAPQHGVPVAARSRDYRHGDLRQEPVDLGTRRAHSARPRRARSPPTASAASAPRATRRARWCLCSSTTRCSASGRRSST